MNKQNSNNLESLSKKKDYDFSKLDSFVELLIDNLVENDSDFSLDLASNHDAAYLRNKYIDYDAALSIAAIDNFVEDNAIFDELLEENMETPKDDGVLRDTLTLDELFYDAPKKKGNLSVTPPKEIRTEAIRSLKLLNDIHKDLSDKLKKCYIKISHLLIHEPAEITDRVVNVYVKDLAQKKLKEKNNIKAKETRKLTTETMSLGDKMKERTSFFTQKISERKKSLGTDKSEIREASTYKVKYSFKPAEEKVISDEIVVFVSNIQSDLSLLNEMITSFDPESIYSLGNYFVFDNDKMEELITLYTKHKFNLLKGPYEMSVANPSFKPHFMLIEDSTSSFWNLERGAFRNFLIKESMSAGIPFLVENMPDSLVLVNEDKKIGLAYGSIFSPVDALKENQRYITSPDYEYGVKEFSDTSLVDNFIGMDKLNIKRLFVASAEKQGYYYIDNEEEKIKHERALSEQGYKLPDSKCIICVGKDREYSIYNFASDEVFFKDLPKQVEKTKDL